MGFAHGLVCCGYWQPGLWANALSKVKAVIISLGCCLFEHRFVFPRTGALCQAFSQDCSGALSKKLIVAMELLLKLGPFKTFFMQPLWSVNFIDPEGCKMKVLNGPVFYASYSQSP
jgi:hypothetical protein